MSDPGSLSTQARAELFSVSSAVTLTSVVLAVIGAYITDVWIEDSLIVVGVMGAIGIGVPSLYREWSIDLPLSSAVLWTVTVSVLAYVIYSIIAVASTRLGASAAVSAFAALAVTASLGIVFPLYRTRLA